MTVNGRTLFSFAIVLLMAYMVINGLDYSRRAALFPVAVGSVILVMALLQLVGDLFPGSTRFLTFLRQRGVSLHGKVPGATATPSANGSEQAAAQAADAAGRAADRAVWLRVYGIIACLLLFTVLMYHTQFLVAVPLFLVLFIWLAGRERLRDAVLVSTGTMAVLYLLFKAILKVTF